jgi:hypothetical protein
MASIDKVTSKFGPEILFVYSRAGLQYCALMPILDSRLGCVARAFTMSARSLKGWRLLNSGGNMNGEATGFCHVPLLVGK